MLYIWLTSHFQLQILHRGVKYIMKYQLDPTFEYSSRQGLLKSKAVWQNHMVLQMTVIMGIICFLRSEKSEKEKGGFPTLKMLVTAWI